MAGGRRLPSRQRPTARPRPRRRVGIAAGAFAAAATLGLASIVSAYTVLGATFSPGHGAPGATVRVTGLPLAVDCPDIRVWLSPEQDATSSITSPSDPRLVRLAGTVSHPRIGAGGIGDTRHGTLFTFVVPGLRAGTYATFSECIPASGGFGFSSGATPFTVDAATPDTDTIGANPGPATDPAGGAPGAATDRKAAHALLLAVGALASIGLAVRPRRRRRLPVS